VYFGISSTEPVCYITTQLVVYLINLKDASASYITLYFLLIISILYISALNFLTYYLITMHILTLNLSTAKCIHVPPTGDVST